MTAPAAITYLRYRTGEPRESRVFPPMEADHPAADAPCPVCGQPLAGQETRLLALGPDDEEAREKAAAGRWYTALAIVGHADCLTPGWRTG